MANASIDRVVGHLKRVTALSDLSRATDRELLRRFAESKDEIAFSEVVRRHGPLVMGTCRRVLRHQHDAEDAFQAVFLVLARKAASIAWSDSISYWLHEVAMRTSMKARTSNAKRRNRLRAELAEPAVPEAIPSESRIADILDEEIRRLPRQYGSAVVLCCLQDASLAEAASRLGVTEGSVRARLWRGRELLRKRLASRGVTLPSLVAGATTLLPYSLSAAVPAGLLSTISGAATNFVAQTLPSTNATLLAQGVLQAMIVQKVKLMLATGLAVLVMVTGAGVWLHEAEAKRAEPDPIRVAKLDARELPRPKINAKFVRRLDDENAKERRQEIEVQFRSVDVAKRTVVVECEIDDQKKEVTFVVAADAEIVVARQKLTLKEIQPKMVGSLWLMEKDKETAVRIQAMWPTYKAKLSTVDASKNTLAVKLEANNGLEVDQPYPVTADAEILIDGMISSLADLSGGQEVEFEFSLDRKSLVRIEAEGSADELHGRFKSFDATKNILLVTLEVSGFRTERNVDLALDVTKGATVRHQGKDATFADLKVGMPLRMKLQADRKTVANVWAVDATKDNDD